MSGPNQYAAQHPGALFVYGARARDGADYETAQDANQYIARPWMGTIGVEVQTTTAGDFAQNTNNAG